MNIKNLSFSATIALTFFSLVGCRNEINTVCDSHFDSDGYSTMDDSTEIAFKPERPTKINFYVEVSGSMNGFFRANKVTQFKTDVWEILNRYTKEVTILTNNGSIGTTMPLATFQKNMNTGSFVSTASTQVPTMLETIFNNIDTDKGEVAVLISDMKYSPVGSAAPNVLLAQYSTDISKILNTNKKAVCLVGATSDYLDKNGNTIAKESPYYYFIIGNAKQVASARNDISSLLDINNHFIDNIETGFDYGRATCTFGIPDNCYQLESQPTFIGFSGDTCKIKLEIPIENYRWILAEPEIFAESFKANAIYGSNCSVTDIQFDVQNVNKINGRNELIRKATAIVELSIYDMAMDSEVIEWKLELPETNYSKFAQYFQDIDENDPNTSYSLMDFVKGMFFNSNISKALDPNYILISRNQ